MAENRTINIDINQNAEEAAKGFNSLNNALDETNKSVRDVNKTFEEVYGDLQPLTTRLGEAEDRLYELAAAGQTTTQEYKDLLQTVANYRQVQIQTDAVVDAASTRLDEKLGGALQGAASGFAGAQGAMALMGNESEALEKTLVKLQGAMAIAESVRGIREGATSFKALGMQGKLAFQGLTSAGKLFAVTGIGLLITGITLLITNFDKVVAFIKPVIDAVKAIGDAIGLTDFAGEEAAAKEKKRKEREAADIKRQIELKQRAFEEEQKAIQRTINLYNAQGKDVEKLTRLKLENAAKVKKALLEEQKQLVSNTEYYAKNGSDLQRAIAQTSQDILAQSIQDAKDAQNELDVYNAEQEKKRIDNAKEVAQANRDLARQIKDEQIKQIEDQQERELASLAESLKRQKQDVENTKASQKQKGILINELTETYEIQKLAIIQKYADAEAEKRRKISEERTQIQAKTLADINKKEEKSQNYLFDLQAQAFAKQLELDKKEKERIKQLNEYRVQAVKDGLQTISNLAELFAGKSEKQQKRAFQVQKAVNIANAVIDTYKAANTALASSPPPFNYIAMAAAITAGLVNVKKIASQQFQSSSSSSGGGGTPSAPEVAQAAPQFNTIGSSGINQLAQLQQQPVQAYVVSGEVTSAQALDRNRIQNATL
jgi:hypothetical protein